MVPQMQRQEPQQQSLKLLKVISRSNIDDYAIMMTIFTAFHTKGFSKRLVVILQCFTKYHDLPESNCDVLSSAE